MTITSKLIAAAATVAVLAPALALAQSANVTTSVNADVSAAGVTASASTTLSASVVSKAKSRADTELDRRTTALNDLNVRVGQMTRVTADFKTSLTNTITAQISALASLKAKIDADTDDATLKADVQSITTSYRIYALILPQARIAAAADREVNIATMESALGAKLQSRIQALPSGTDTSALTAALGDLASTTNDGVAQAQASVTATASLEPDQGVASVQASNTAALKQGRSDIQAGQKDLAQARADITTIVNGLKKLEGSASASAAASTTVSQ